MMMMIDSCRACHSTTNVLPHSQSCRVPDCGYDAGDCGTEHWEELYQISPKNGSNYTIPLGTTAMFFNMTHVFFNGTISSAEHTPSQLIRTAVVAQRFKTLSLTFARNVSLSTTNFTIGGTNANGIKTVVSTNWNVCPSYRLFQ